MQTEQVTTEAGTGEKTGRRILQLDGLRGIAIIAVFLHHAFQVRMLWMGVDLFFVLSGFLITGILMAHRKNSLGEYFGSFYRRRVRRIYPPYVLFLVLTTILFGAAWMRHFYLYFFLMNLLLPLNAVGSFTLIVLWSLAVEEQFYLVWPFAVYSVSEAKLGWVAGGLVVLAPILRWLCTPMFSSYWTIYFLTPFRMDCLAAGALFAVLWRSFRPEVERVGRYGLLLTALACVTLALLSRIPGFITTANTRATNVLVYEMSMLAATGLMLWALSGYWVWVLKLAPLRYIGRISYSMYLIHQTALIIAGRYVHSTAAVGLVGAALTVGYSALSWRLLEQPLLGRAPAEGTVIRA